MCSNSRQTGASAYLVDICGTIGRSCNKGRIDCVGNRALRSRLFYGASGIRQNHHGYAEGGRSSPPWVDSVVNNWSTMTGPDDVSNQNSEHIVRWKCGGLECLNNPRAVVLNVFACKHSSTNNSAATGCLVFEHVDVEFKESWELFGDGGEWNSKGFQLGE
jgi:hypothetical protein